MRSALALLFLVLVSGCPRPERPEAPAASNRLSILLVTLDTTRADAMGPDTPSFQALAARGTQFRYAYATTPQTLPSHSSMMTGLYPAGHGVHENGRYLSASHPLIAEELRSAGYRTAAFVSAFAVARRFGLARGFEIYDDDFGPDRAQRPAVETTDRAIAFLKDRDHEPFFLWVHYYDPHYPYEPPEPFRSRYPDEPYRGEVASMDEQLGRVIDAFEETAGDERAIIVAADHGEGLGDHGEQQHGNLLYQEVMLVPLVIAGPGVTPGVSDSPVTTRRIYHTIRDWAGFDGAQSLRREHREVVLGEAMKPFLDYGWKPQVMAVEGRQKAILAGRLEVYDVAADPGETKDHGSDAPLSRELRAALRDYPIPSPQAAAQSDALSEEERRQLASLGYVSASTPPVVRPDAPRPADMTHLFPILDRASGLFVREQYREALPLLQEIRRADPQNLDAALRLAVAYSALGRDAEAEAAFRYAQQIAPQSRDVRAYLGLHYARGAEWRKAEPILEEVIVQESDRLPVLEALAMIRERQQRIDEAVRLREKIYSMRAPTQGEWSRLGAMQMTLGQTAAAIGSFERGRSLNPERFANDLELGVLYLAAGRFAEAREALDRVPENHPAYPMALFKRAQVSVLLREPDSASRIAAARQRADATTRELIENERLFRP